MNDLKEVTNVSVTANSMEGSNLCNFCSSQPAAKANYPCKCMIVCKKCAMKMATGGKCRVCKEYYTGFCSL